jgi:hypothetical protein
VKAIRAILIDPYAFGNDRVRDVPILGTDRLPEYYRLIGCNCTTITAIYPPALEGDCLYLDDDGLWNQYAGFEINSHPEPLMGRAIVVGTDDRGGTISTGWNTHALRARISRWFLSMDRIAEELQN